MDGINKIKKSDVKKSRNIVLSAIKKHDDELKIDRPKTGVKGKGVYLDAIKKISKKEISQIKVAEKQLKSAEKKEEKEEKKEENKAQGPVAKNNVDALSGVGKLEVIAKKPEQVIKKVSKEKRDAWLNEMKGVFDEGEKSSEEEVKEEDYKIKKVVKQADEKVEKNLVATKLKVSKKKFKLFGDKVLEKKPEETVKLKPKEDNYKIKRPVRQADEKSPLESKQDALKKKFRLFGVKVFKKEIKKVIARKKKPVVKKQLKKRNIKGKHKTEDFEFDLTPALSKKRHREVQEKKSDKKGFFEKRKNEKEKVKARKEKLALEKQENKKKIQEKKDELKRTKEKNRLEKERKKKKKREHEKLEKEQRKMKRREKFIVLRFSAKETLGTFFVTCKASLKFLPFLFLMVFSTAFFCYLIFFTLLVKLNFDGSFFRKIAGVFPVPVIISNNGVIEYFKYEDLKEEFYKDSSGAVSSDFKVFLIKKMIVSDLAFEYNVDLKNLTDEELFDEVERKIIFDNNINQVAINRIRKISQLITDGGDFMKIASRYGDAQGHIFIESGSDNKFNDFKTDLSMLKKGEISRIEYTQDGYYIFQSVGDSSDSSYLNYVYVKSKTLNEYIKGEIVLYQLWSFVD